MLVMKFGGSSLADADRIRHVVKIIREERRGALVLVCSAMGDTTDDLLEAGSKALKGDVSVEGIEAKHRKAAADLGIASSVIDPLLTELKNLLSGISLIRELSPRSKDYLVSFGERLAVRIMASYLSKDGMRAEYFDAWDAGMISDSNFTNAEILQESYKEIPKRLRPVLSSGVIPVVTGFLAKDPNGIITTLGRGGSDLSATVLGAALGANEVQVWKDVDGILTADPRIVKEARPVERVTFEEAAELAYFGAQVLHPRSMMPASAAGIPVRVKNSYNTKAEGTLIVSSLDGQGLPVRVITCKRKVIVLDVVSTRMLGHFGFLAKVFEVFAAHRISVDMVATSEVSISLTLDKSNDALEPLTAELERVATVRVKPGKASITLIADTARASHILGNAFSALEDAGISVQMISQGASKVNIGFIVDDAQAEESIRVLHGLFFGKA